MRRIIIDTDTASDDALAIVFALRDPNFEVVAITTVAGNVSLEKATYNALQSIDYAGKYHPPVYAGCDKPMIVSPQNAMHIHGVDGMGDVGTFRKPEQKAEKEHAVDAMIRIIAEGDGDIELVTLGPLTNVALAMQKAPEVMKKIPRISMMGGAHHYTNAYSVSAEFNILVDPHAADIVCDFGVPFTMVTLEACGGDARPKQDFIDQMRALGELGNFCIDCNSTMIQNSVARTGEVSFGMPDPSCIAVLSRPEMIKTSFEAYTRVETTGKFTRGTTVFAQPTTMQVQGFGYPNPPYNSTIVTEVYAEQFHRYALDMVSN